MKQYVIGEYRAFNQSLPQLQNSRKGEFLERIYQEHSEFVRDFVRRHPSHALVEIDITDEASGKIMADAFGLDEKCWGHHNKKEEHSKLANRNSSAAVVKRW